MECKNDLHFREKVPNTLHGHQSVLILWQRELSQCASWELKGSLPVHSHPLGCLNKPTLLYLDNFIPWFHNYSLNVNEHTADVQIRTQDEFTV